MSLKDRITEDMKSAMRARAAERLSAIRMLQAAIKQREVDERISLDDTAVVAIVDKLVKQRKDSIAAFQQAGRTDLVDKESAELQVLQAYLPQRLSAQAVDAAVGALAAALRTELARDLGPADMGRLMGAAKAQLGSQAEMAQVSAAVKAHLAPSRA